MLYEKLDGRPIRHFRILIPIKKSQLYQRRFGRPHLEHSYIFTVNQSFMVHFLWNELDKILVSIALSS